MWASTQWAQKVRNQVDIVNFNPQSLGVNFVNRVVRRIRNHMQNGFNGAVSFWCSSGPEEKWRRSGPAPTTILTALSAKIHNRYILMQLRLYNTGFNWIPTNKPRIKTDGPSVLVNHIKETVSRDFRPPVFFINRWPLGPW
jgi:hypothetical protein